MGQSPCFVIGSPVCYSITEVLKFRWISPLRKMKNDSVPSDPGPFYHTANLPRCKAVSAGFSGKGIRAAPRADVTVL
mgnify:FL=1